MRDEKRVIKDYDPRLLDEDTLEIFYKPTDSLFDYLNMGHMLSIKDFGEQFKLLLLGEPRDESLRPAHEKAVKNLRPPSLKTNSSSNPKPPNSPSDSPSRWRGMRLKQRSW